MREADNTPAPEPTGTETPIAPDPTTGDASEAPADTGTEAPAADGRPRTVPHAALHEERERRKAAEKQATEKEQLWAERFNALLQRFPQQQAPQPPPLPDPEKDPVGHLLERQARQEQLQQQLINAYVQDRQQAAQQHAMQQQQAGIENHARALEAQYAAEVPEYHNAANFLAEARHKELAAIGYDNPAERQEVIRQEARGLAQRAMQMGRNPAEFVHEMARIRGFGAQQAPAASQQASTQVAQITAGQQQARTLGNVRGAAPAGLNANAVMNMSSKDFDKFLSTATQEQMEQVFGS